ncbi:metallo-beta-lactamase family protein [Hyphomonas neptunium ATCC 15444]|uniref:Metallo-beta-lactamase family protein n=2 Tax=Hyphomonas TaxID=85 RepID=Q0BWL0_HYPNA|nr:MULTISPECIES: MBL fold metallo-hydrolase [Hyphomonas]ABI76677.1 metallo-beta-lactamase family protein [Hyphomonas neptunium ATCC 15444]KCZ94708.1 metallo-beta-lactamase family protein [Hyphomonas hirschiana VP5]
MAARWEYTKGLKDIGNGLYAWLQPDGGWGWSNAGLIRDGEASLLVDTLFDMALTREMLGAMADATGIGAGKIGAIVNTHANGDHCHGNGCCPQAEIIASEASAREMAEVPPAMLAQFKKMGAQLGPAGSYFADIFAPFDFENVDERAPTQTFSGTLDLKVGDKAVRLIEVGPAHTGGDVLVHVPGDKAIFTGDILFIDGTPLMWAGPVANWIRACEQIIAMDVDVIVPGHGPVTDKAGVRRVADYLAFVDGEARKRFDAGLGVREAALDIALGDYASWGDAERIAVNVDSLYREYRGDGKVTPVIELFALMADVRDAQRR